MALLETFGGHLPSRDLQKYLFLYTTLCEKDKSYDFVPYKYGCFSFQSYVDKNKLIERGHLADEEDWKIRDARKKYSNKINNGEQKKLTLFHNKYKNLKGTKLVHYIYKNYPYFAINSVIAKDILNDNEMKIVNSERVKIDSAILATVGYEGISFESYLNKLIKNDIKLLIDVRKNPISRKYGFSKKTLSAALNNLNIEYVHMPALGIESSERKYLRSVNDYKNLFHRYKNKQLTKNNSEVDKVYDLLKSYKRIALTCFEKTSELCHRGTLANYISDRYNDVTTEHI